jgi:probable rRNA maturation factor
MPRLVVEIYDELPSRRIPHRRLKEAVRHVLAEAGITQGEVSLAIVGDARMQALNRQYLDHDWTTDVLSFVLEADPRRHRLDGQIIVNADYAQREAERVGWTRDDELLLYAIHGALHLTGMDDQTPQDRQAMRLAEARHLKTFGLEHRFDEPHER